MSPIDVIVQVGQYSVAADLSTLKYGTQNCCWGLFPPSCIECISRLMVRGIGCISARLSPGPWGDFPGRWSLHLCCLPWKKNLQEIARMYQEELKKSWSEDTDPHDQVFFSLLVLTKITISSLPVSLKSYQVSQTVYMDPCSWCSSSHRPVLAPFQ